MENKLQELTDRLYKEGLSKGKAEGEELLAKAEEKAARIVEDALKKAEEITKKAENDARDFRVKVEGDVRMAATQSIQTVKKDIENLMINGMTGGKAKEAMSSAEFVKEVITNVARNFNSQESVDLELTLPETMRSELEPFVKNQLSSLLSSNVTAKFSRKIPGGFTIGPKDGSYFIDLTAESFESLIKEYLRPATKKLLFGE